MHCLTRSLCALDRVLATRDIFEALAPAVARTGVCLRRVHYLYRDVATVHGDVEVRMSQRCAAGVACDVSL